MKLVFVFSGYGAQTWNMGRELFEHEPVFRISIEECADLAAESGGWPLLREFKADRVKTSDGTNIQVNQLKIFSLQIALTALWRSLGVTANAVVGHCIGEVAAAYTAGAITLLDGIRISTQMGRLFQKVADNKSRQGTMFAIKASIEHVKETVEAFDEVGLSIAAHNGPFSVVISGDRTNCMNIVTHFWNRHIPCCEIAVPGAGHSAHVDCILHELSASLATVPARSERIPIYSTVSGTLARGQDFQGEYWSRNARQTVLFAEAVETLRKDGYKMFLELNAHPLLCGAIAECFRVHKQDVVVRPSLECGRDDSTVLGETLLALNTVGLQN